MDFNVLLGMEGIAPETVALALHKATGGAVGRRILCALAAEDEAAFDAHQSTHPRIQEATVRGRTYMASFVPGADGEMQFLGVYEKLGEQPTTLSELLSDPDFARMLALFNQCDVSEAHRFVSSYDGRLRFSFRRMMALDALRGRLIVRDPGARNYMRRAEATPLQIVQVTREARIAQPMPDWDVVALMAAELPSLPRDWGIRLAAWRGIYLITDQKDGARYVGAAYGEENILGRWRAHVAGEAGITAELRKRHTADFRFSILELVAPTAPPEIVIARERNWMDRLDTIRHGLNA